MGMIGKTRSALRATINTTMRKVIRDEATRKLLVERHYAKAAGRVNAGGESAPHTADDLLDWRATMGFRLDCSREVYRANSFYGIGEALRRFAGAPSCIKACVEHGVHFGSYVNDQELEGSGLPCLVTFGSARLEHIRAVSAVPVVMAGPYIAYAEDYLVRDDLVAAKGRLGRTLLVFPTHSVDRVRVSYELSAFVSEIERVKAECGVETVLVCLYYRDLLNGVAEAYEKRGYRVVTAGYREDSLFLARQRSLIQLADLTMSNNVGTHVGYCAYMGKPHYVFDQEKLYSSDSPLDDSEFDNAFAASQSLEKAEVAAAFSSFSGVVTSAQQEALDRYWGFGEVLDYEAMSSLFAICEEAYEESPRNRQERFRVLLSQAGLADALDGE